MEEENNIKEEIQDNQNVENNNKVNNPNEVNNQDLMPVKKNNGLVIALVVIILLLAGGLIYVLFFTKDEEKGNDNPQVTPTPSSTVEPIPSDNPQVTPTSEPTSENEYELTIYKYKDDGRLSTREKGDEYFVEAFKIKTSTNNAKLLDISEDDLFIIYNDDGIKIYNVKTKEIKNTNLSSEYENYMAIINNNKTDVLGIGFRDKKSYVGYYNIKVGKSFYYSSKKYKQDNSYFIWSVTDNYLAMNSEEGTSYLLNANYEKEELIYKDSCGSFGVDESQGENIYILACGDDIFTIKKMYNKNLKEFYSGEVDEYGYSFYNGIVYLKENNTIKQYNSNGELIRTSKDYDTIKGIINNYVLYIKDNYLVLENIDDTSESKQIVKWNNSYYLDEVMTRYYSRKSLDEMEEKNKKEGIYIVIYYDDGGSKKDSNGYYGMEYCYTSDKQIVEYPIKEEMGGRAKPVLYLYPTKETDVTVKFAHPEYLTTTYPKYLSSWNVTVKPNGDMYDKDGKYYYALYWDETRYSETNFKEGFYVESKDAIKFLEEKLTIIGLNDKELNEFIMYWLPIMEANGKNLVYFELTEEREASNKLIITPKPDSLLRVSIHIKKVNEKVNIPEQKLKTFKRSGFTAVEWGGMTY